MCHQDSCYFPVLVALPLLPNCSTSRYARRNCGGEMAESKRDWLGVGISLLSLGIAGLTGYKTIFDQRDDVRFVVGDALKIRRDKKDFVLQQDQALTFVNSGNRQAVIS